MHVDTVQHKRREEYSTWYTGNAVLPTSYMYRTQGRQEKQQDARSHSRTVHTRAVPRDENSSHKVGQ